MHLCATRHKSSEIVNHAKSRKSATLSKLVPKYHVSFYFCLFLRAGGRLSAAHLPIHEWQVVEEPEGGSVAIERLPEDVMPDGLEAIARRVGEAPGPPVSRNLPAREDDGHGRLPVGEGASANARGRRPELGPDGPAVRRLAAAVVGDPAVATVATVATVASAASAALLLLLLCLWWLLHEHPHGIASPVAACLALLHWLKSSMVGRQGE